MHLHCSEQVSIFTAVPGSLEVAVRPFRHLNSGKQLSICLRVVLMTKHFLFWSLERERPHHYFQNNFNSKCWCFSSSKKLNRDLLWDTQRLGMHKKSKGKHLNVERLSFQGTSILSATQNQQYSWDFHTKASTGSS